MTSTSLDLSSLPPIYILPTHLQTDDLHEAEDALYQAHGRLTYRASEARIFLGRIMHKRRAAFDLRAAGVWTEEELSLTTTPSAKRRKLDPESEVRVSDSGSDTVGDSDDPSGKRKNSSTSISMSQLDLSSHIVVLRLTWLEASLRKNTVLPHSPYLIYSGKIVQKPSDESPPKPLKDGITYIKATPTKPSSVSQQQTQDPTARITSILSRARADPTSKPVDTASPSPFGHRRRFNQTSPSQSSSHHAQPPKLHRTTTSEYEEAENHDLPHAPAWLLAPHSQPLYSCLRSTYLTNPNTHFIAQLTRIKEARLLTLDEIGVRAYSTSIAALSAYSHRITSPLEITRLPGCDQKIATLWVEWRDSIIGDDPALDHKRTIPIVRDLEADTDLQHLRLFFEIWGVGADTARKFYFQNGWKDLDDIVQFGWNTLSRVQQIGVKFYDEFQVKIPRTEVEDIALTILRHARLCKSIPSGFWTDDHAVRKSWLNGRGQVTDPRDFVCVIVGGYRRGKVESGDVDVILSHRDERMTHDLVVDVVASLESEGFITHTLSLHTTTSDRGGGTLPFRADGTGGGHGFDSLDKALCVWQDPEFDNDDTHDDDNNPSNSAPRKNPNIHRRVDIIVSSWKTVGCAVMGWSGGTTYQRDVRRWVKRERGWKFDSSGVRDRRNGLVMDLETPGIQDKNDGDGWEDRERRLMENLGVGWRPADERCTG